MSKQIEAQDGWPIGKVAEFLNLSKSTLYIWSCYDRWGGKYPPARFQKRQRYNSRG